MNNLNIQHMPSKKGEGTIEVNGYLLHSKYDPIKEAERFVEKEIDGEIVTVIFGLGKGYILNVLKEKEFNPEKIIIIEPIKELQPVPQRNFTVLKGEPTKIIKEEIEKKLTYYNSEVKVVSLPNYDRLFIEEYKELLQTVKDVQWLNVVNDNTVRGQSHLWQENEIKNTLNAYYGNSLNVLRKAYKSPVIVASGGPSLSKQLSMLKKVNSKAIIIAAGSTLITLQKEGITPDYIASIDGNKGNFERHFKDNDIGDSQLIYSFSNYYEIQKNFPNSTYGFVDNLESTLHRHLCENYNIDLPRLEGGGSVANFALSIARFITTGPIALIGQDLAYTDNQTHAKHNKGAMVVTSEFLTSRGAVEIEGYYGDKVVTDYSLISMKERFEAIMENIEQPNLIYNCTEGGVKIRGMQQMTFIDFCKNYVIDEASKKILVNEKPNCILNKLMEQYKKELRVYTSFIVELKKGIKALEITKKQNYFNHSTLNTMEKIEKKFKLGIEQVLMGSIINPIIMDVMLKYEEKQKESEKERFLRVHSQNETLYNRLLEATQLSKNFTEEALTELRMKMEEQK